MTPTKKIRNWNRNMLQVANAVLDYYSPRRDSHATVDFDWLVKIDSDTLLEQYELNAGDTVRSPTPPASALRPAAPGQPRVCVQQQLPQQHLQPPPLLQRLLLQQQQQQQQP